MERKTKLLVPQKGICCKTMDDRFATAKVGAREDRVMSDLVVIGGQWRGQNGERSTSRISFGDVGQTLRPPLISVRPVSNMQLASAPLTRMEALWWRKWGTGSVSDLG
jgi:hypothetical protein